MIYNGQFRNAIKHESHLNPSLLRWQLVVMPDMRSKSSYNDRFFVPLGPQVIYEALVTRGFDVTYVNLDLWYWQEGRHLLPDGRWFNLVTSPDSSHFDISAYVGHTELHSFRDAILGQLSPERGTLISSQFSSFSWQDANIQFCLLMPLWLKDLGVPYIVLGGARCKRQLAKHMISQCVAIDAAFYHEMWSVPNENELHVLLEALNNECQYHVKGDQKLHCFLRDNVGELTDLNREAERRYHCIERIYTPVFSHSIVKSHSFTIFDLFPRSMVDVISRYGFSKGETYPGVVSVKFTDGCPNRCAFCDASFLQPRALSPALAADYLESVQQDTGARFFFFLNRQLNITNDYLESFCKEVIRRHLDIRWSDSFNLDMWSSGFASWLREAGCVRACAGVETLSPRLRKLVGRPQNIKKVQDAIGELHDNGIWVMLNFIVGLPHETMSEVDTTYNFLRKLEGQYQWVLLSKFKLYPSSLFAANPEKYGLAIREPQTKVIHDDASYSAFSFEYDEVGGRNWSECQKHIDEAYVKLVRALNPVYQRLSGNFPLLAACYDHFSSKQNIISFMADIAGEVEKRGLQSVIGVQDQRRSDSAYPGSHRSACSIRRRW